MKMVFSSRKHHCMARFSIFLVMVALIAGMVGCGDGDSDKSHTLTIASTAGGNVTMPGEGTFTYDEGTVVNLVAEAEEGYRFVNWTGDVGTIANANDARTTVDISLFPSEPAAAGQYSFTANFVSVYNLTVSSTGVGSVTVPGEGTFTYDEGTVVNLEAIPNGDSQFLNWTGDVGTIADVNDATTTITMNEDYSVAAHFFNQVPVRNNEDGQCNVCG